MKRNGILRFKKIAIILFVLMMFMMIIPLMKVKAGSVGALPYAILLGGDGTFEASTKLGDINLDGIVTDRDFYLLDLYLSNKIQKENLPGLKNADINLDGTVDRNDLESFIFSNESYVVINNYFSDAGYTINEYPIGTKFKLGVTTNWTNHEEINGSVGETYSYKEDILKTNVEWISSNEEIATVNQNTGEVTIIGKGEVVIIATINNVDEDEKNTGAVMKELNKAKITLFGIDCEESYEGITISADSNVRSVGIAIYDNELVNNMAAVSMDIMINNIGDQEPIIEYVGCGNEEWTITQKRWENGVLSLIAEAKDENITQNTERNNDFVMSFIVPETFVLGQMPYNSTEIVINTSTFKISSRTSQVTNPLSEYNIEHKNENFGTYLYEDEPAWVVGERPGIYMDETNDYIFAKLNGTNNKTESYSTIGDFVNRLRLRAGYTVSFKDFLGNTIDDISLTLEKDKNGQYYITFTNGGDIKLGNVGSIEISKTIGEVTNTINYRIIELGDICKDENMSIDINDVNYLRRAIVKEFKTNYPENFVLEATDVDLETIFSNEERKLGDIGDVIAIRKRIINKVWDE